VASQPFQAEMEGPKPPLVLPFDDTDRREHPGRIDIGTRRGDTVTVDIADLSGTAVIGPTADDIVRAVIAAMVARAGPGGAEVFLPTDLVNRLLPGVESVRAIRRAKGPDDIVRVIEAEVIARTRRLSAEGVLDAVSYRQAVTEDPMPLLLAVCSDLPEEFVGRWSALLAGAAHLDIAALFLAANGAGTGRLVCDGNRIVTGAAPRPLDDLLIGSQLFGLNASEASDVLHAVCDSGGPEEFDAMSVEGGQTMTGLHSSQLHHRVLSIPPERSPSGGESWFARSRHAVGGPPIVVQLLGPYRISVHGELVTTGLRRRAKALLAWYLVRPQGATTDESVEALWPDTPPERVQRQFWYALGDLRARLRGPGNGGVDVLTKDGDRYLPITHEIACDLWEFQHALNDIARANDDSETREALQRALDTYRGDLVEGSDYFWVETVRQDLHRRALDVHLRLAELELSMGHHDTAVGVLEQAINLDGYAEEPYRRLMAIHATRGRPDAVAATWRLLNQRLGDLDLDVESVTIRLYRSIIDVR